LALESNTEGWSNTANGSGALYHTKAELDYSTLFSSIATFPMLKETADQSRRPLY